MESSQPGLKGSTSSYKGKERGSKALNEHNEKRKIGNPHLTYHYV